jgi:acetoin utilization protein AcuB
MKHPVITVPMIYHCRCTKFDEARTYPPCACDKRRRISWHRSEKDLLNASPSPATTLSIFEINYLISKIKVSEVMHKEVYTVGEDTPIEEAARIMADKKIGGLLVTRGEAIVGIITETDLFKILLEMLGARENGIRVTVLMREERGQLAKLTQVISGAQGNFIALGQFAGADPSNRMVTFKVTGIGMEELKKLVEPLVEKLVDIREMKV